MDMTQTAGHIHIILVAFNMMRFVKGCYLEVGNIAAEDLIKTKGRRKPRRQHGHVAGACYMAIS